MNVHKFDCGCEFQVVNESIKPIDGLPGIRIDYENLNERCPNAWALFAKGYTKGIFQLETNLGQNWAKKLEPVTIEEVSALTAILRPGMLKYIFEGKSMTQHFVDRKHLREDFEYFHELAEPILGETYGTMTYQEQILSIAKIFAGFNLQQADTLRKGIGKKKADVVAKCRTEFIDGCDRLGIISEEVASQVFDNIEKANRYSFNKSHAICYGTTAYMCAVPKAHFPLHFFVAWLNFAKQKIKPKIEIAELIQEAKLFDISVENPNISHKNENFLMERGKIRYGLGSIKSVGTENVKKVLEVIAKSEEILQKTVHEFTWHEVLIYLLSGVRKDVVHNLIHAGALSHYGMSRQRMLFEYNKLCSIDTHIPWIQAHVTDSLINDIKNVIENKPKINVKQKEKLLNLLLSVETPPSNLVDAIEVVANCEEDVLGIPLSCSKLDAKNLGYTNCTCKEFIDGTHTQNVIIPIQLSRVTEWSPPKNPASKICFLTGFDKTGKIDAMVPSKEYENYKFLLFVGNTVAIHGSINERQNLKAKVITQL